MTTKAEGSEFSGVRGMFFPIHGYELKKILPLGLILFFFIFDFYCLKNIKDTLIVTNIGAEALPFIKLFCIPPAAIFAMLLYTKASDLLDNEYLFYVTVSSFLLFFGLFSFWIYPNREWLHPNPETVHHWQINWPSFKWVLGLIGTWSYTLFFIFAELWGGILLTLSFWQFANQITHVAEAKRVYPFLALVGQSSVMFSGILGKHASDILDKVPAGIDAWQVSLNHLIGVVIVTGFLAMGLYRWIYKYILTDKRFYDKPHLPGIDPYKKTKAGLWKSLKLAFTSPYLGMIAVLVICCGIDINLVEGLWKNQIRYVYTNENSYNTFMSHYTIIIGIFSVLVLLFGGNILRLFRWSVAAMATPILLLIGGSVFFLAILFESSIRESFARFGESIFSKTIVIIGTTVLVIVKSVKFALFDLSKEMAYIPLDEEMKVKGKAVVDVLGGRLSESSGAGIQVFLLMILGWYFGQAATYEVIAPYCFGIFLFTLAVWIVVIRLLSKRIKEANKSAGEIENE